VETVDEIHEKIQYSDGAKAGAVVGGMVAGILFGSLIAFGITYMMKRKMNASPTGGLVFRNISFRPGNKRREDNEGIVTMDHPNDSTT
jgi:hypothetical protein